MDVVVYCPAGFAMHSAIAAGIAFITLVAQVRAPKPDVWEPLRFLVGTWEGTSTGRPGTGTVRREYRFVLGNRFLEVRNTSSYPAQTANPKGEVHEDLGYISYDSGRRAFVFRQFHVEGFVNTYLGEVTPTGIVFTSEAIENFIPGFTAREVYRRDGERFIERFELAESGKDFTLYSESTLTRVR